MAAKFFSAILIYTKDVERLGTFYRDVLGIPLEDEKHGNEPLHYGCELGELHFAIHGAKDGMNPGVGSTCLAFEVFDIEAHMKDMAAHNVNILQQPIDMGFMKRSVIADPDGNRVEFTELAKSWIEHLRSRRAEGQDLLTEWDKRHS